jgi:16S rRNA C1402 (ribose-2'-O) methylase RsmI
MINLFSKDFYLTKGRQTRYLALAEETRTMILYVSPHKLVKTLANSSSILAKTVKFQFRII